MFEREGWKSGDGVRGEEEGVEPNDVSLSSTPSHHYGVALALPLHLCWYSFLVLVSTSFMIFSFQIQIQVVVLI